VKRNLCRCLLAAGLICTAVPPASSQTLRFRQSHVPIQGGISPDVADAFLESRLRDAQTAADLERLITELAQHPEKLGIDSPKDQQKLRQILPRAGVQPEEVLADPDIRRIIDDAAQKAGTRDINPEERRRLEELARRFGRGEWSDLGQSSTPAIRPAAPGATAPSPDGAPPPSPAPSDPLPVLPEPPPEPAANSPMKDRLRDITGALADSPLAESPAFRRMVAGLDRVKTPDAPDHASWDKRLERWQQSFAEAGGRLPKISWPKTGGSQRGTRRRAPAESVVPTESTESGGGGVFLMLGAAAAGVLAWGILRRRGLLLPRGTAREWRLGPWPVRPEAVGTRDELVRAFEYLALLRLGPAARNRNHREIAAGLGGTDQSLRHPAERLAGLYEQARYAPPDEALPDADLADARAALSLLAGVAAA
jgi:hypothetical protein